MFVVEVTALAVTLILGRDLFTGAMRYRFRAPLALWLWFTVLFANFAEAMAEARVRRRPTTRKTRTETQAKILRAGKEEIVPATSLRRGDVVIVRAGDTFPATARWSRVWRPSTRLRLPANQRQFRQSGGDRSAVTGGATVISDWIRVRITANPGETFLDKMIALVEGAERKERQTRSH